MAEGKRIMSWTDEAVKELMFNILDDLKQMDESAVMEWIRENWPSSEEVYS